MLPLHTFGKVEGDLIGTPLKVLTLKEALKNSFPLSRIAVFLENIDDVNLFSLKKMGFAAVLIKLDLKQPDRLPITVIHSLRNQDVVNNGDVIRARNDNGQIRVLYRRGANANSLFVTERCNSKCIMCSQPPKEEDDSWLASEILSFIELIDKDQKFLGITGGEPTLLGESLKNIIDRCLVHHPNMKLHVLSNGRNFANPELVKSLHVAQRNVTWAIPLYSDLPHIHDFIVQANNAHADTLNGIYNLVEYGHKIEIRLVLHKQTVPRLRQYVEFIYRNLPFVHHVALMGLEPMGYAKMNQRDLWIDPADYAQELTKAAFYLHDRGVAVSVYNIPLCALPKPAWPLAKQSISDWKNSYDSECERCSEQNNCCGFFMSQGPTWKSRLIKAITKEELSNVE